MVTKLFEKWSQKIFLQARINLVHDDDVAGRWETDDLRTLGKRSVGKHVLPRALITFCLPFFRDVTKIGQ